MSLQTQVKEDMVSAMKSRDKETLSILRVLLGEFLRVKDENGNSVKTVGILGKYLPVMLGEFQIKTIVSGIIHANQYSGMQDMGKVMGTLKTHPIAAQIDNKLASQITRELLTQ